MENHVIGVIGLVAFGIVSWKTHTILKRLEAARRD